jgi:hypothetical protein
MARSRWYPTATMVSDGRALVVSRDNITRNLSEIYDPTAEA